MSQHDMRSEIECIKVGEIDHTNTHNRSSEWRKIQ